jgi:polyisoprenoid-binding protein YceI
MRATVMAAALWVTAPVGFRVGVAPRNDPAPAEARLWITGSSNIRRFTCRARGLSGHVALRADNGAREILAGSNITEAPSLTVPIAQLDCGIGRMKWHLREAVHASDHPNVDFRLDRYEANLASDTPTVRIVGRVAIAGVARPVVLDARLAADSFGVLHVQGVYVVRMTDFGVTPPRRFGGLFKVRDRIAVHFDAIPTPDDEATDFVSRAWPARSDP